MNKVDKCFSPITKILFIFAMVVFVYSDASACRCQDESIERKFEKADYVFLARVTKAYEVIDNSDPYDHFGYPRSLHSKKYDNYFIKADFYTIESFKGDVSDIGYVRSGDLSSGCSIILAVGATYLFFIDNKANAVNLCNGSWEYNDFLKNNKNVLDEIRQLSTKFNKK